MILGDLVNHQYIIELVLWVLRKILYILRSTQFPPGYLGGKATQFQKGQAPPNKGQKMSKQMAHNK
jgi:hypothetical protein